MSKVLTILGFMGSGKSTIGKMLAKEWGYNFIDLDHYIEGKYHMTIPQIFDKYDEGGFRKLEAETLKEVVSKNIDTIVSLGGGTPCFENNMELIQQYSTSIYLKISAQELVQRLLRSNNPRPLVQNKTKSELLDYVINELKRREPFYNMASQIIESDNIQISDLITFLPRL